MTPVGAYRIVDFKADSRFQFFMLLNYPNLVDGWHGYRERTINAAQFKAIASAWRNGATPPQDTSITSDPSAPKVAVRDIRFAP